MTSKLPPLDAAQILTMADRCHVVEIRDCLDAAELERIQGEFRAVPDWSVVVLDVDCPEGETQAAVQLFQTIPEASDRGVMVGTLVRRCGQSATLLALLSPICAVVPGALIEGANIGEARLPWLADMVLALKPKASRRLVSRLFRDHVATSDDLVAGMLAVEADGPETVAQHLLAELGLATQSTI